MADLPARGRRRGWYPEAIGASDRIHPATIARIALGLSLLLRSEQIGELVAGERLERRWVMAGRVLGLRHLAEASVVNVKPSAGLALAGAAVDAIHACTAAGFGLVDSRRRRLVWASAIVAALFSAAGAHHALWLTRIRSDGDA
jgi:hypothetical protein